jgi:hypothetical protein
MPGEFLSSLLSRPGELLPAVTIIEQADGGRAQGLWIGGHYHARDSVHDGVSKTRNVVGDNWHPVGGGLHGDDAPSLPGAW